MYMGVLVTLSNGFWHMGRDKRTTSFVQGWSGRQAGAADGGGVFLAEQL